MLWPIGVLFLIVFAGMLLRLHKLGTVHSWFDESLGWRMSQFSPSEIVARSERNVHPPFHFLLLSGWRALFGGSLLTLRFYSVLWGIGTILGGYFLAKSALRDSQEWRSEFAGLLAAVLIAFSAIQIDWSQQVKMYSLGTCLTLWSTWCLLRWFQGRGTSALVGYVPLAAGLTLQHHYGTFTVLAQLTFALFWGVRRAVAGSWSKDFLPVLLTAWATTSLWALWLPSFLIQRALVKESYWIGEFHWKDVVNVWSELFLFGSSWKSSSTASWGVAEGVLVCVLLLLIHRQPGARMVGWLVLIPYAISVAWSVLDENVLISRFLIYAHVSLLVGIGILVASFPARPVQAVLVLLLIGGMGWTAAEQYEKRTRWAALPGMPSVIAILRDSKAEQDLVLVCNPMLFLNVCVHNDGLENVYAFDPGRGFPHFQGTPVMKEEEYLRPEDLQGSNREWIWTLDAENWLGGTWKVHLPAEWKLESEQKISEWYATLVIRCYHREPGLHRSSSAVVER